MHFHSMFEEMHAAMEEMMDVRRGMLDRMFGDFGGSSSVFPWFSSLREEFDRDFQRDFAFPRFPRLREQPLRAAAAPASAAPVAIAAGAKSQPLPEQPQPQSPQPQPQPASAPGTSVMYSTQQCYNSADPSKNYSRHTTTQLGPGGVLESRTAVRDNREGEERIEVRRQLGDRYTHVTRKRRLDTGEETVERRSHNLPGEELTPFEEEWNRLAKQFLPMYHSGTQAESSGAAIGEPQKASSEAGVGKGTVPSQAQTQAQAQPTTVSLQK
eukprot:RCo050410